MEKVINMRLLEHIEENELLCENQHGFIKGRSCLTNLLTTLEHWTREMDRGKDVDVIYLDFAKAFDSVPHKRLLKKIEGYGISGQVLKWIRDFLHDRKQRVVYNDLASDWTEVWSGVPQGSVLGPTLFLIYVMDIPEEIDSNVAMFADDTKIYRVVQNDKDAERLQGDLDTIIKWSETWMMRFNVSKCKHMKISRNIADYYHLLM